MSKPRRRRIQAGPPIERRGVDVLTVGWMLSVMTTFFCELGAVLATLLELWTRPASPHEGPSLLPMLAGLLLFAAAVVGLVSLVITPLVLKNRRERPPTTVTVFAVVVGAAPLVAMIVRFLSG